MPPGGAAPTGSPGVGGGRYGEVFDRGYKHYEGTRLGRRAAALALVRYSMKRAMGIKKSWTARVIPFLLYLSAALTAVIIVGIESFTDQEIISYPGFFDLIYLIMGVYVATIAPEMLCGDRRENVLPLYFSRAITRTDYVLAKLAATALLTLTISFLPGLVVWLGRQLAADAPLTAMGDNLGDLLRVALAGTLIALYLGAGGLMISSFTGRKGIAVAIIIVGLIVIEGLVVALLFATGPDLDRFLVFLSPTNTVDLMTARLFDAPEVAAPELAAIDWAAWVYVAEMLGVALLACAVMYIRYVPRE
jgi:ABC-2 type transport system permease protein